MNKQKYLERAAHIQIDIDSLQQVVNELESALDGIQAVTFTEKFKGSNIPDDTVLVNKICRIMELKERISKKIDLQFKVIESIEKMKDPEEKALLRMKYLSGMTWEQISDKMGYSIRQIYNIKDRAIRNFEIMQ